MIFPSMRNILTENFNSIFLEKKKNRIQMNSKWIMLGMIK